MRKGKVFTRVAGSCAGAQGIRGVSRVLSFLGSCCSIPTEHHAKAQGGVSPRTWMGPEAVRS